MVRTTLSRNRCETLSLPITLSSNLNRDKKPLDAALILLDALRLWRWYRCTLLAYVFKSP